MTNCIKGNSFTKQDTSHICEISLLKVKQTFCVCQNFVIFCDIYMWQFFCEAVLKTRAVD